ncbi:Rpn family recombination-promoting nuclease/putative transposase [Fibrobacter sp.]
MTIDLKDGVSFDVTEHFREYSVQKTFEEIKKRTYIDPLYDVGFKVFMNDEYALMNFLNGVFHLKGKKKITSVTVKNPEIALVFPVPKPFKLDIRATAANGFSINIEMQKAHPTNFVDRVLLQHCAFMLQSKYEWDQTHLAPLPPDAIAADKIRSNREKIRYKIPPTFAIWICDFKVPRQKGYSGTWAIRNDEGLTVSNKVKYIIYDLTKFTKSLENIKSDEDRWLYLLKNAGKSNNLPDFSNDIIAKAIKRILVGNVSEDLLRQQATNMVMTEEELDYLAYLKTRAEAKGMAKGIAEGRAKGLAEGREEGRAEGREEGREEGANSKAREIAKAMLADGDSLEKVARISGLSESDILRIKANIETK